MARDKKKEGALTPKEKLEQALVPGWEQPYKVPKNWCWVYLSNVCEYMRAGGDKPRTFSEERTVELNVPVVANGIQNEGIIGFTDVEDEKAGTVTVSGRGTIGYPILREYPYYPVVRLIVLAPNKTILPNYLKNVFFCLAEEGTGSSIPQLTVPMLKSKPVPVAPLFEQQRIVDRIEYLFAKLDEAKEKAQSVLDSFENHKAAILHKAFTGELTAKWRKDHGTKLDSWSQGCLRDFCEVNPKKAVTKDLPDDLEVSFVPMPALSDILGEITDPQVRKLKDVRTGFTNFAEGDVVFAKITPCMENGKSAVVGPLVNSLGFGTTEFYVLRCSKMLLNRYLYHLVRSQAFRAEAKSVMTGAVGQQRVPKSFLEDYPITIPTVPEQIEIVRILDSLFAKEQQAKEAAEAVLEKIDLIKKSILARAFRGELGTNDPTEESVLELLKQVLQEDVPAVPKKRNKSIPKELQAKLATELERKIVKLYFKQETDSLPAEELLSVSSKKFEVMDSLHNLEQRGILKKLPNGNYRLLE